MFISSSEKYKNPYGTLLRTKDTDPFSTTDNNRRPSNFYFSPSPANKLSFPSFLSWNFLSWSPGLLGHQVQGPHYDCRRKLLRKPFRKLAWGGGSLTAHTQTTPLDHFNQFVNLKKFKIIIKIIIILVFCFAVQKILKAIIIVII